MLILAVALALLAPGPPLSELDAFAPAPPLCRVTATAQPSAVPFLLNIEVAVRPDCPQNGVAYVRLENRYTGALDPVHGFVTLRGSYPRAHVFRGVLPPYTDAFGNTVGWMPYWSAASGLSYRVPVLYPPT